MRTVVLGLSFVVANVAAFQAKAFGLGKAEVLSRLGQPLNVNIPLILSPSEHFRKDEVTVRLAPPAVYQRSGIEYPYQLDLRTGIQTRNGRPTLHLSTSRPVHEPLLSLLIQMQWGRGRLVKEVSFFLDPPVLAPRSTTIPVRTARGVSHSYAPPASVAGPGPAAGRRVGGARYGPVVPGETLYRIARALSRGRGTEVARMAEALYRRNPKAFAGSRDVLLKGAILDVPTREEIARIDLDARPGTPPARVGDMPSSKVNPASESETKGKGLGSDFYLVAPRSEQGVGRPAQRASAPGADATGAPGGAAGPGGTVDRDRGGAGAPASVRSQLHEAREQIDALRVESQLTRETLARLEQQMLATRSRLKQLVEDYQGVLKVLENSVRERKATSVPAPPPVASAETVPAPGSAPVWKDWVPWWILGPGALISVGVLILILRLVKGRRRGTAGSAEAFATIPSGTVRQTQPPFSRRRGDPTLQGDSAEIRWAAVSSPRAAPTRQEAPDGVGSKTRPDEGGSVISEYLSVDERNLMDPRVQDQIIETPDNHAVKLLLLTFFRESGRYREMRQLAERMLARHPDLPRLVRDQIQAFRQLRAADADPDPDDEPTVVLAHPRRDPGNDEDSDDEQYAPGTVEIDQLPDSAHEWKKEAEHGTSGLSGHRHHGVGDGKHGTV